MEVGGFGALNNLINGEKVVESCRCPNFNGEVLLSPFLAIFSVALFGFFHLSELVVALPFFGTETQIAVIGVCTRAHAWQSGNQERELREKP